MATSREILSVSLPYSMAEECRKMAIQNGESLSQFFRDMFTFYRREHLKSTLKSLQTFGKSKAKELAISEEEIEKWVFEDR